MISISVRVEVFEPFSSIALPMVKKSFTKGLANDIVKTQPMSAPSGLLFNLDLAYKPGDLHPEYQIKQIIFDL